ncbi:hypothetical protein ACRARG_04525 [Pseudooceanicola sp. C21-150M6]|uniref:hypothetical protein n=1 Tax=Pseudooceanicola sp. C21-150M6 TaxID=3434355 RepID=UPI003D7FF8B7
MTDIASLGFAVDSSSAVKATSDLDRLGDQAAITEKQVVKAGKNSSRAFSSMSAPMRDISKASRSFDSRGIAMQLSQVAQQASATGQPLRALAIQLPDIAMYLGGPLAIGAGVAAGALLPLVGNFISAASGATDFDDAMDQLASTAEGLEAVLSTLKMDVVDLYEEYGNAAGRVREFALLQAELRVNAAQDVFKQQASILRDTAGAYFTASHSLRDLRNALTRIEADFGLTNAQAKEFEAIVQASATADTFDKQQAALQDMVRYLDDAGVSLRDIPPEFAAALDKTIDLSNETDRLAALADAVVDATDGLAPSIGAGANEASRLAENLAVAAMNAQAAQTAQWKALQGPVLGGRGNVVPDRTDVALMGLGGVRVTYPSKGRSGGRKGGGGRSAVDEQAREAERWIRRAETALDKYNREIADLNELQEAGYLSAEQFAQAQALVTEEFERTEFGPIRDGIQGLTEDLLQAAVAGDNVGKALLRFLADAAIRSAARDLSNALSGLWGSGSGGSFLGNVAGWLFGGFRASGGPVSSGTSYIVGEKGPELFTPTASGTITPNHAMGGNSKVTVELAVPEGVTIGQVRQVAGDVAVQVVTRNNQSQARRMSSQPKSMTGIA